MRKLLFLASIAAAIPVFAPAVARADVTDSEKQAARSLFLEGVDLQNAGRYADALERFQKAQRVIDAPTHLLRIAQCQVALGHLVEGAESYRKAKVENPGANAAFQQAVQQASDELKALEPRIPKLKIDVSPKDAANLTVQVDGQAVNTALLDERLPVDPGTHVVTAMAQGYSADQKQVTLDERAQKTIALTLVANAVVYPNPPPAGSGENTYNPNPPPPRYEPSARPAWARPVARAPGAAPVSFLIGARGGAEIAGGSFMQGSNGNNASLSDVGTTGGAFGIDGGVRLGKLYLGLFYEFASYGKGDHAATFVQSGEDLQARATSAQNVTTSLTNHYFGIDLGYISNPDGVGIYADIGVGYRMMPHNIKIDDSATGGSLDLTETFTGPEFKFAFGIYIRAGSWLRLIPKATFGLGSFSNVTTSCTSTMTDFQCATFPGGGSATSLTSSFTSASHSFIFLGLGGYFDQEVR